MKYCEEEDKAPINWHERIDQAEQGLIKPAEAYLPAASWVTCACGNQCAVIPRTYKGEPKDGELSKLGMRFYKCILREHWEQARITLNQIELRSAQLIREMKQKEKMNIKNVADILKNIKRYIHDDSRVDDDPNEPDPGITVTIATTDGSQWGWQSGDNSYSGGAYGYRHWSVVYLYRNSNCRDLARDAVNELKDMIAMYQTENETTEPECL